MKMVLTSTSCGVDCFIMVRDTFKERKSGYGGGMLDVRCKHCGRTLRIPEEYLGLWGTCTHCKGRICVMVEPVEACPVAIQAQEEKQVSTKEDRAFQTLGEAKASKVAEEEPSNPATPGQETQVNPSLGKISPEKGVDEKEPTTFYEAWRAWNKKHREEEDLFFGAERMKKWRDGCDKASQVGCALTFLGWVVFPICVILLLALVALVKAVFGI